MFNEVGRDNVIKIDLYVKYNSLTHGTRSSTVELTPEKSRIVGAYQHLQTEALIS